MTEWKRFKDNKPTEDIFALVSNEKGWMFNQPATYEHKDQVWIWYSPCIPNRLVLDVTHYLEIPPTPWLAQ